MLSHILYGSASLTHGGLKFRARAAGKRGEQVTLEIVATAGALTVAVAFKPVGPPGAIAADIRISRPAGATERQVLAAAMASADFKRVASIVQAAGDGTAVVALLAKTNFVAADGLQQHLRSKLGIQRWDARTLVTTGAPQGDIWPSEAKLERSHPMDEADTWIGVVLVGIALNQEPGYELQNAVLDGFRRALVMALKVFEHEDLADIGPITCGYTNVEDDKDAGQAKKGARLNVVAHCPIRWCEPAFEPEELEYFPLDHIQVGLFREPDETSVEVVGDGEVLDQQLTITPEE